METMHALSVREIEEIKFGETVILSLPLLHQNRHGLCLIYMCYLSYDTAEQLPNHFSTVPYNKIKQVHLIEKAS